MYKIWTKRVSKVIKGWFLPSRVGGSLTYSVTLSHIFSTVYSTEDPYSLLFLIFGYG